MTLTNPINPTESDLTKLHLNKLSPDQLKFLIKEATEELKTKKIISKETAQEKYGDYYEATYKWLEINSMFSIKINKSTVSMKIRDEEIEVPNQYLDVIDRLNLLHHLIIKMYPKTYKKIKIIEFADKNRWLVDTTNASTSSHNNIQTAVGIDFKNSCTVYTITDDEYYIADNLEIDSTPLSDPKFPEKTLKDLKIKVKGLINAQELMREFPANAIKLSKLKLITK